MSLRPRFVEVGPKQGERVFLFFAQRCWTSKPHNTISQKISQFSEFVKVGTEYLPFCDLMAVVYGEEANGTLHFRPLENAPDFSQGQLFWSNQYVCILIISQVTDQHRMVSLCVWGDQTRGRFGDSGNGLDNVELLKPQFVQGARLGLFSVQSILNRHEKIMLFPNPFLATNITVPLQYGLDDTGRVLQLTCIRDNDDRRWIGWDIEC